MTADGGLGCVLFRVDAGARIGSGHLMRCLSLAEALGDAGVPTVVLSSRESGAFAERIAGVGAEWVPLDDAPGSSADARATLECARARGAGWVVADGYHFGAEYQERLKEGGVRLLCVDDDGQAGRYRCDVVLNQNRHADPALYADRAGYTRLLLGSGYVLLRGEFRRRIGELRPYPGDHLLVTLGGSDPTNATSRVLSALEVLRDPPSRVAVVVGGANPHAAEIQRQVEASGLPVRLLRNSGRMADLMAWAGLAVSSGGSTVWELLFMGTPAVLGATVPVEELLIGGVRDLPWVHDAGRFDRTGPEELAGAIERGFATAREWAPRETRRGDWLVDGKGCDRVIATMREITFGGAADGE